MKADMNTNALLRAISKEKIVIYGTGHVARKFLKALKLYHLKKQILCFVISTSEKNMKNEVDGIAVRDIEWLKEHRNILVCIAVHEASKNEIIHMVRNYTGNPCVWIYPYLYELLLGMPLEKNVSVRLADIVQTCTNDYRLAIRWAAINNYYGKNENGFDMYKRAQGLHSSSETAKERLEKFCALINKWEKGEYDGRSIFINTKYEIIDGNHRVALAGYYHQQEIVCDIFSGNISVSEIHGEEAMLTRKILLMGGFSENEFKMLDNINEMIRGGCLM